MPADAKTTTIQSLEHLIWHGRPREAVELLFPLLVERRLPAIAEEPHDEFEVQRLVTRFAAVLQYGLGSPSVRLSGPAAVRLLSVSSFIAGIFEASGFQDGEHAADSVSALIDGQRTFDSTDAFVRWLLFIGIAGLSPAVGAQIAALPPEFAQAATLGFLSDPFVPSEAGEATRQALMAQAVRQPCRLAGFPDAAEAGRAWMLCSYSEAADRHTSFKSWLNKGFADYARALVRDTAPPSPPPRARPLVAVACELMKSSHVMFRCYAALIEELRASFELVGIAAPDTLDDAARRLFDRVVDVTDDPAHAIPAVFALRPDVLYFPSLGMRAWTIALANVRCAPIQVMSPGHPATSSSPCVDYFILGRDIFVDAACFSERVIVLDSPGSLYREHVDALSAASAPPAPPRAGEAVRIGIPANERKLTAGFIAACKRIAGAARRPIEFWFFPAASSWEYLRLRQVLRQGLGEVRVFPTARYPQYMAWLSACDLVLSPFPFGNASSTIDALSLALPVVALRSPEPAGMTDQRIMAALDCADALVASTPDAYEKLALRLIDEPAWRASIAARLGRAAVTERLFRDEHTRHRGEFARAFEWLVRNHGRVQRLTQRVWRTEDRVLLDAQNAGALES